MGHLKEITEENLPKIINRYYKFGEKELKVGDKVGVVMLEVNSDDEKNQMELHTYVVDEGGVAYILTNKNNDN
jgi:hypothetical protein